MSSSKSGVPANTDFQNTEIPGFGKDSRRDILYALIILVPVIPVYTPSL